jgi:hypothetical protein
MGGSLTLGALVDCVLPGLIGVLFTLLGYRVIGPKPGANLTYDYRFAKYGRVYRVLGAVLIVTSVYRTAFRLAL